MALLSFTLQIKDLNCEQAKTYPIYIKPPETVQNIEEVSVILAGGCSVPWRNEFKNLLKEQPIVLIDPIGDECDRPFWEHLSIDKADILLMWIPQEGECRGSLVEFGRFLEMKDKPLFVGVHPCSPLYQEFLIQVKIRPEVKIANSLLELSNQLHQFFEK